MGVHDESYVILNPLQRKGLVDWWTDVINMAQE